MTDALRRTYVLESPPDDVETVHDLLASLWSEAPQVTNGDRIRFETALIELAANVMTYAVPGGTVECTLLIEVTDVRIIATLTDSGYEADIPLTDGRMPGELQEAGRGLLLMRALVDEIEYTREGDLNRWRIARNLAE
ncbi:ATP-binding protein [Cryobacterium sp. BB307]|uniref:ATP-binding protein n=1 Tax=Cryobacterium sp. BB307 TaxID=2716317 RepID=UPI0014485E2C|nr:ATP-binding protein [Cryobacterium sp. BB307]